MSTTIQPRAVAANAGGTQRAGVREWTALAVLLLPVLLVAVDATVLSFALPSISEALQPSGTQLLWMIDIYSLVLAGLLVSMGSLADRVGRRRLLLIGSVGFAVVSVIAAYAPTAEALIAARAALGFFGAMLMPSTLSLLRNIFIDRQQRRLAVAIWAAGFSGGAALGPIVGGFLLEHYWWGSAFLMAVPVLVLLLILAPIFVPESKDPTPGPVDVVSIGDVIENEMLRIEPLDHVGLNADADNLDPRALTPRDRSVQIGVEGARVRRQACGLTVRPDHQHAPLLRLAQQALARDPHTLAINVLVEPGGVPVAPGEAPANLCRHPLVEAFVDRHEKRLVAAIGSTPIRASSFPISLLMPPVIRPVVKPITLFRIATRSSVCDMA